MAVYNTVGYYVFCDILHTHIPKLHIAIGIVYYVSVYLQEMLFVLDFNNDKHYSCLYMESNVFCVGFNYLICNCICPLL